MRGNAGRKGLSVVVAVAAMIGGLAARAESVNYRLVTVGNAGNAADSTGYGAVAYDYRIGKYEVTAGQYTTFLNAVDAAGTQANSIYTPTVGISFNAGAPLGSRFAVQGSPNRPINGTSWWSAARFANWMHNGQGAGDTETGAYNLNGAASGPAPAKNAGARFFIPTENEWYKAAYFSPILNGGAGGYYTYATQSNAFPGNTAGSAPNQANWYTNALSDVGAFSGSGSFYGTFDQNGNVEEWNDLTGAAGPTRLWRGGAASDAGAGVMWGLSSADRWPSWFGPLPDPSFNLGPIGFRLGDSLVSAVPEIDASSFGLAFSCLLGSLALLDRRRVRAG